jgi:hypothetical protein
MEYKIKCEYRTSDVKEFYMYYGGHSYCVIYGQHISGGFCCVPEWSWGCDMGSPRDVSYNADKLERAGADEKAARAIAEAIKEFSVVSRFHGYDKEEN